MSIKNLAYPNVLIVDDLRENIFLLKSTIEHLEINIFEAISGYKAIELAAETEFALLLMDVTMPGMTGFQALEKIRELKGKESVPVIFISAYDFSEPHMLDGIENGAIDFIAKPFNKSILIGKIKQYVSQYKRQKELDRLVSELETTNSKLHESEIRFRNITYTANESIIVLDKDLRISFWNRASKLIFGYSKSEVFNEEIVDLLLSDKSKDKFMGMVFAALNSHEIGARSLEELTAKNKVGFELPIEISVAPLKSEKEQDNIVVVIRDITNRKKMERAAFKARELRETNKGMKVFVDNVSHEMRTPMNAILGISKMILKHSSENLTEQQVEGINLINSSGTRLLDLINDVLDISKLESNAAKVDNEEFDFHKFITTTKSVVINLIGCKDIRFKIRMSRDIPPVIIADQKKINQILLNLLGNSVKFTDKGKIVLSVHRIQNRLFFEIYDTGVGISEKNLSKIFKRFHQIDSSDSKKYKGTGLGLDICKKSVELLGGKISASSKEGEFTLMKFHIRLPSENDKFIDDSSFRYKLKDEEEQTIDAPPNKSIALVIEDDPFYKMHFENLLKRHEYFVVLASNGKTGLKLIYELVPDIIFLNLEVSKISGYNIIRNFTEYSKLYYPKVFVRSDVENFEYSGFDSNILLLKNPDVEKEVLLKLPADTSKTKQINLKQLVFHDQNPRDISYKFYKASLPVGSFVLESYVQAQSIIYRRNVRNIILVCSIKSGPIASCFMELQNNFPEINFIIHLTHGLIKEDFPIKSGGKNVFFANDLSMVEFNDCTQLVNQLKLND